MSVTAERLMVEVRADVRQALSELNRLDRQTTTMGARLGKAARGMGLAFGGAAVVGGITKTINLAKNFDLTMRQVGVQTDQTGKHLEGLSNLALKMGKDTVFSAQDAGGAMLELAKGGLSAAQIRAGALKNTLLLASAGGMDLATSAGYMVQALTTFHLKAGQADQVATALAGGANASTASVESLGQALSQVGPGARNAGLSLQETVAALAAFDNAGIKGSDAGTSLKTMLARLVPQTDKAAGAMRDYGLEFVKADGNFKSLAAISQNLRKGLGKLSESQKTQALTTIFGSDATRAAAVLMDNGRKGITKYVKATKDQTQAQKLAKTNMEGAAGAIENFKGTVETAAISLGRKFLPTVTEMLNKGTEFINDASTWGPKVSESFGWMIPAAKNAAKALAGIFHIAESGVRLFDSLPDPVKSSATQVAIFALAAWKIVPALQAGAATMTGYVARLQQTRAELTYTATRTQVLSGVMARLGAATRMAAGAAGMMLLAHSSSKAHDSLGFLSKVAGGALLGFSAAGPWGAAIGAGAGALYGLASATSTSAVEMVGAKDKAKAFAKTLDQTTGAITGLSRASILASQQKKWGEAWPGIVKNLRTVGLSTRDLVGYIAGEEAATKRLNGAIRDNKNARDGQRRAAATALDLTRQFARGDRADAASAQKTVRTKAAAIATWKEALRSVPKEVRVAIKQAGYRPSMDQIKSLAKQYHLTPKQVRTLVRVSGADKAKADAKGVKRALEDTGKTKANTGKWLNSLTDGLRTGKTNAQHGAVDILHALEREPKRAKWDFGNWVTSIRSGNKAAASAASTGGHQVGANLKAGVIEGFSGTQAQLSAQAAAAVHAAVAAAKHAGDIHSPSRKMAKIGHELGRGLETGLEKRRKAIKEKGRDLVHDLVHGIRESWASAKRTLSALAKWVHKAMAGDREDRYLHKIKRAHNRLERQYEAHHRIMNRLQDAQDVLAARRDRKRQFIGSTREGMTSQANVLNAGNNATTIAASLVAQVAKVKEFAGLLKKLKRMGYDRRIIEQIAAAGVEGGLAAARALAEANATDFASINQSYATIYQIAGNTANTLGGSLYNAGISAAEGLVAGLKKRKKEIEQTIIDIAMAMQKAIKKALGIKSPSRVMAALGRHTGRGFADGILSQEAAVAAAAGRLARAAQPGAFAAPTVGPADTFARTTPSTRAALTTPVATAGATFQFNTYNPVAEPQSRTTNKALARVASLGLV